MQTRKLDPQALWQKQHWDLDGLNELIRQRFPESTTVEFKEGDALDDAEKPAEWLRRIVVALCNSGGGVLVVGVSETDPNGRRLQDKAASLDPIKTTRPRGGLAEWAMTAINAGVFPGIGHAVKAWTFSDEDDGQYLVVRAPQPAATLYSCRVGGRDVFPIRVGASTINLDHWAVQAILTGNRRSPSIKVGDYLKNLSPRRPHGDSGPIRVDVRLAVQNQGLVWAHGLTWGLCSPVEGYTSPMRDRRRGRPATSALESQLSVGALHPRCHNVQNITPPPNAKFDLPPFTSFEVAVSLDIPQCESFGARLALYVVGPQLLPQWFSVFVWYRSSPDVEFDLVQLEVAATTAPVAVAFERS